MWLYALPLVELYGTPGGSMTASIQACKVLFYWRVRKPFVGAAVTILVVFEGGFEKVSLGCSLGENWMVPKNEGGMTPCLKGRKETPGTTEVVLAGREPLGPRPFNSERFSSATWQQNDFHAVGADFWGAGYQPRVPSKKTPTGGCSNTSGSSNPTPPL